MMKILIAVVVEKSMNMIEILQSKRSQFYLLDINSLIILALAFCGVIISSTVYAKDIFNVELKCKGNDQEYCDIVKILIIKLLSF